MQTELDLGFMRTAVSISRSASTQFQSQKSSRLPRVARASADEGSISNARTIAAFAFGNVHEPGAYQYSAINECALERPMSAGTCPLSTRSTASNCSAAALSAPAVRFSRRYAPLQ